MKVILVVGKFYRREHGDLVKYQPGDVFNAPPDELRRLEAKEQVFIRKGASAPPPAPKPTEQPEITKPIALESAEPEQPVVEQLDDVALLERYADKSGSWYVFQDGRKVQGRVKALDIARELHG